MFRRSVIHIRRSSQRRPARKGGYTTYTCEVCGNELISDYTEAPGHSYVTTVHPATCVSYGYTEHLCATCGDRYVTDYVNALGHTFLDIVVEATQEIVGYTRHLCIVCNYSYLSDFVTSGDDGYIVGEEPEPEHRHKYELHVQDFPEDKYFIALRVCSCGASNVGNLEIRLTNDAGEVMQLFANEYGQVDYTALNGDWRVSIYDESGVMLKEFELSAGNAAEPPDEPEKPNEGEEQPEPPDDENLDGESGETPEELAEGEGGSNTATILLIVFVLLVAGGIGAIIFLKKRKKENQNE